MSRIKYDFSGKTLAFELEIGDTVNGKEVILIERSGRVGISAYQLEGCSLKKVDTFTEVRGIVVKNNIKGGLFYGRGQSK